ncbi:SCO7613 C-terminal domain-containing membrane protein, partial [Geodermatophilus sp. CPCC 205761]|uniref:SCO7613 C-terminal domain-containing membrane protein n=1 Tax=Geodermatophilus sp. CPCC 205761 TaxID=2936597 RepID=UPI003EEDF6DA
VPPAASHPLAGLAQVARAALGVAHRVRRGAQAAIGVPAPPVPPSPPDPAATDRGTRRDTEPRPVRERPPTRDERIAAVAASPAWRAGAAQLVLAAWLLAAVAEWHVLEVYTLPAALGLLVAAGPRVATGRSAAAWGPALWVAAAPSVAYAVLAPGSQRPVAVFVVAATAMALGAWRSVRAPVVAGGVTAVTLALGLLAVQLPLPIAGALVVGAALLGVGAWREQLLRRRRQESDAGGTPEPAGHADGFRTRLADMR